MKYLFIFGMYRSGTTTLSKLIDCFERVSLRNDPLFFFFRSLRNSLYKKSSDKNKKKFGHYIFDNLEKKVFDRICKINLKKKIINKKKLIDEILINIKKYQPDLKEQIKKNNGKTYYSFLTNFLNEISKLKKNVKYAGLKEVWITEFYPCLKKNLNNSKFIFLVRDPRAVIASALNNKKNLYDIYFLINQWRKISGLSSSYYEKDKSKVLLIKYENIIKNFNKETKKICLFLKIKNVSPKIIIKNLKFEKKWSQNSTYKNKSKNFFNKYSLDIWKRKLSKDQIKFIEFILYEEMKILNYQPTYIKKLDFDQNNYKNNLKKFISIEDINNEINRKKIIYNIKKEYESYYFLNKQIFNQLRLSTKN